MKTETPQTDWTKPQEVSQLDMAFGGAGGSLDRMVPAWDTIPEEFRKSSARTKWHTAQGRWFFSGIKADDFTPKAGIDRDIALRHLRTIQASFQPKHEHKMAAVAWLMSLWFDDVKNP